MRRALCSLLVLLVVPPVWADDVKKTAARTFHVPYKLTSTNHVLIRVKINGKGPYNFILDTGAPALFVGTKVADKVGVKPDRDGWGKFKRIELEGGVVLENFKGRVENPFQLEGMNGLGLAGVELHGMIGYTLLARYRLEFDFTKHKMGWTPLDFKPDAPMGLDGHGAPGGMDALGGMMKLLGGFLGKTPEPKVILRGFLGIGLEEKDGAVFVKAVLADSPAAAAGLKAGDRVSKFQSKEVSTVAAVHRLTARLVPDEAVQVTVLREGKPHAVTITLGRGM